MNLSGQRRSDAFEDVGSRDIPAEWIVSVIIDSGRGLEATSYRGRSRVLAWFHTQAARSKGYVVEVLARKAGSLTFAPYATYQPF